MLAWLSSSVVQHDQTPWYYRLELALELIDLLGIKRSNETVLTHIMCLKAAHRIC